MGDLKNQMEDKYVWSHMGQFGKRDCQEESQKNRLNKTFAETAVAMSILQRKGESLYICLKMYSALEITAYFMVKESAQTIL